MVKTAWALLLLLALMLTAPAGAEPLDAKTPVRGWTILSNSESEPTHGRSAFSSALPTCCDARTSRDTKSGWPKETRGFPNPYAGLTFK